MADAIPILSATDLQKSFGGVRALKGVSLSLLPGEVHALIGENGAGKSTLIKILTGAHTPDAGALTFAGHPVTTFAPGHARKLGIAAVYQQPALFADLTVAENLGLRLDQGSLWRRINWKQRRARAAELLAKVGAPDISPDTRVADLGMAAQQLIEIAAAVGSNARLIIFDEPTASLGHRDTERLFAVIRDLKQSGVAMLYVSHRLEELSQIAQKVTVLRDGTYITTRDLSTIDRPELIRLMVGRSVETLYPNRTRPTGETVLDVRNLTSAAAGIRDIALSIGSGEVLGLGGLVGAGRTELARVLFGLTPSDSGTISIEGKPLALRSPGDAVAAGIAYLPEDRRRHGVILDFTVAENTSLAILPSLSKATLLDTKRENELALDYITRLATKTPSPETPVANLSGGNQQKVALARWLATRPKLLILDEPTQGVDIGAKAEIHSLITNLAQGGLAILLISSDLPELLAMSDRIAVMASGKIQATLPRDQATPERLLELALPPATHTTRAA